MSRHDEDIAADRGDWSGLDEDGWDDGISQPEREEPDFEAEAYSEHLEEAHGGGECDCPPPPPIEPARPGDPDYATEAPF